MQKTSDVMLEELELEFQSLSKGAEFKRADLHIHTYGTEGVGSYDVTDAQMTPQNIVDTAIKQGLSVISITDHNVIGNVEKAVEHAKGQYLLVIPGVELSTPQGHLLVYFPGIRELKTFYGKLAISQDFKRCEQTIVQCLNLACEYNGIGIAAHIDNDSGFERVMQKYDEFKCDVLKCTNLLALEITSIQNVGWFTDLDDNPQRKNIHSIRRNHLKEEEIYELPKVMNSDAHTLTSLGRNASGAKKLTRLKMESLSFDSFRIALRDASARTRIEDLVPQEIPHFVGMKIEGGLLADQTIHFSKNLTCIIGGRGTGKSTMLESLRVASGHRTETGLLDSDVWPDRISLVYRDESGGQHVFSRTKLNEAVNLTNPEDGLVQIPIESYGQGETADRIQHCDDDPAILLSFLDDYVDIKNSYELEQDIRNQLVDSQTEIEQLRLNVKTIPDIERAKTTAQNHVNLLRAKEASKIVELEEKLAKGKLFRKRLITDLRNSIASIKESLSDTSVEELMNNADGSSLVAGIDEFEEMKKTVQAYTQKIHGISEQINIESDKVLADLKTQILRWSGKEGEAQQEVEKIRQELQARNIPLDIVFIRKVTADASRYQTQLEELNRKKRRLAIAEEERKTLLTELRKVLTNRFNQRQTFAIRLNAALKSTVVDYTVKLKFREGSLSPAFEELLKTTAAWRTIQVQRAKHIASTISPLAFADAVRKNNHTPIYDIVDSQKNRVFPLEEAKRIIAIFRNDKSLFDLERCEFQDLPDLKISKTFEGPDGKPRNTTKEFAHLSLGQQQSLLLSIMLFSDSNAPLVIDQPEDNLDSEFIYKTFVKTLRSVKERRQVIVVTHNANIAVLGDAELIIPLRSTNDRSIIRSRGSIDTSNTKELTCTILEGSAQAFVKRREVYGHE